jgi:ABC transport system ATP-binding/permease protein
MALLTVMDGHLAFGHVALLDGTDFALQPGERVGLIGRNGTGKSSLLKVMAGTEKLDDGALQIQQGVRITYVPQEPQFKPGATVFDAVSEGVAEARNLRERFEAHSPDEDLDALYSRIDALDGWNWEQRVEEVLQRLHLPPQSLVESLSGGTKKRVALGQALAAAPDVLLLDEPTNHLDLDAIEWLQGLLVQWRGALVVVSHDRAFIDAVATRIVELDRGRLRSYPGNFTTYETTKARELLDEALANARADKLLAQEEVWVRQGVEARRTRSVARIGRLEALRSERAARRDRAGNVQLEVNAGERSGKLVAELEEVSLGFGGAPVVANFSTSVMRGDKIGLIGPNGAGKTTLLKLLLGELAPQTGKARLGARVQVAYFDQMRAALDMEATLADTISPGSEWVEIGNNRKHVKSYLGDFLFSPARADSPVRTLSGGERNRLLLARLFALPANVLVLDEPTNDLDIDTLELLEELLQSYSGTVLLVSHDRRFLDNVVTSVIAWEGEDRPGFWREYVGGYEDWKLQRARMAAAPAPAPVAEAPKTAAKPAAAAGNAAPKKLSYKEQQDLATLPGRIEALEAEQKALEARLASPELYAQGTQQAADLHARFGKLEEELMAALERWEALSARA